MARKKDDDKSGTGWAIFGAAAAVGATALLAYGAKKLVDYLDEEDEKKKVDQNKNKPKCEDEWYDKPVNDRESAPSTSRNNLGTDDVPPQERLALTAEKNSAISRNFSLEKELRSSSLSLQNKLLSYHNGYVNISSDDMSRAKTVLMDIKKAIKQYFEIKHPNLVTELKDCGSATEGLKVIRPDEFDIMIPIHVHPDAFNITSDGSVPGYLILKKNTRSEMYSSLNDFTVLDENSQTEYLSPQKLRSKFQSYISKAVNGIQEYTIRSGSKGPSIMLTVFYDRDKSFDIDFVPVVIHREQWIVAKPHPEYLKHDKHEYEKFWRESFSHQESAILSRLPATSCHKKCLKIAKAVRLNSRSLFGMFSSYVFKTILLHMIHDIGGEYPIEEEWQEDALQERFIDFFDLLLQHLRKGNLPHHFNPHVNLLEEFNDATIENAKNYLTKIVSKNKFDDLLITSY